MTWVEAIPFIISVAALLGLIARLFLTMHRLVRRFEEQLPTLERIAKQFPGKTLERRMADLEHVIDLQSQELHRVAVIVERRQGDRRQGERRQAQP